MPDTPFFVGEALRGYQTAKEEVNPHSENLDCRVEIKHFFSTPCLRVPGPVAAPAVACAPLIYPPTTSLSFCQAFSLGNAEEKADAPTLKLPRRIQRADTAGGRNLSKKILPGISKQAENLTAENCDRTDKLHENT